MKTKSSPRFGACRLALVCTLGLAVPRLVHAQAGGVQALPIPPGFDFPADQAALLKLRDTQNVSGMRLHAWTVFAGMTQKAPGGEAIWETWHSQGEAFRAGPALQGVRTIQREFAAPRQFKAPAGPGPQAAGISLASFVLYNDANFKFIRTGKFYLAKTLNDLNAGFPSNTPLEKRAIADFPPDSVSIKTVWWVVKKTGLTAMPIWDPVPLKAQQPSMDIDTWKRAVAVAASRADIPASGKANVNLFGVAKPDSNVVSLDRFYSFPMDQAAIAAIQRIGMVPNIDDAEPGDHLVLVAMHFTTKEIPDWVWGTMWWHDQPDAGPFAKDRPAKVAGVWKNYLMDVSFSMKLPPEADGSANIVFNPWLEARFPNGANSNCMTCHQRAVWPNPGSFLPITRGGMAPADPFFARRTKVDFLWSIADLAR